MLIINSASVKAHNSSLSCYFDEYYFQNGLQADMIDELLAITREGEPGNNVCLRFSSQSNIPEIEELAIMSGKGQLQLLATNMIPEYRIDSGLRGVT